MAKRWGNNGNSERLYFLRLQNHCRWWLQPWYYNTLPAWEKSYNQPDSILKSRDITLLIKVHLVKAMVFPVVMYGCESWTIKKAESWRIDAFELWCWRRFLRVPWTARRSNLSILKEISLWIFIRRTELKLKLQYFGHLMQRTDSLEKKLWWKERLRAGGGGDNRERDGWMALPTQWTWVWGSSRSWWWTGKPGMLQSMGSQRVGHDWTELKWKNFKFMLICLSSLNSSGYTLSLSNSSLVNTPHRLSSCNHIQLHTQTSINPLLDFRICWLMTSFGYSLFKMLCWLITYRSRNNIIAHFTVSAQTI